LTTITKSSQSVWQTFLLIGLSTLVLSITHEFSHWATCEQLGYSCFLRLNAAGSLTESHIQWHFVVIDAAGPLLTLLTACGVFYLIVKRGFKSLVPVLLACFAMRLLASIFGVFAMHNDEARISVWLGLAPHVLPFIICLFLFFLVYKASSKYGISIQQNAFHLVIIYLFFFLIIAVDQKYHFRLV
jgi:hypothetical protein